MKMRIKIPALKKEDSMGDLAFKTGSSIAVERCQVCDSPYLESILFLGYLPPVNEFHPIGQRPREQPSYPAQLLHCPRCHLVQLGLIVDAAILFPPEYPYTSSTTKILRENFAELYRECVSLIQLGPEDLVVDIGSNDGNLLSNFTAHRVLGVTPEKVGSLAVEQGIATIFDYFTHEVAQKILSEHKKAKVVTATNVFAHMENINDVVKNILLILAEDGMFISESHYLASLIETLQYDTVYHEHLRYYSLRSLKHLLEMHGLEIIHAKKIPTHGGSIRVYACRKGSYPVRESVAALLMEEQTILAPKKLLVEFKEKVVVSKLALQSLLLGIKQQGKRIYGIGAPSRASTLINYVGIDEGIVDAIMEIKGSHKIGKYVPGTLIPVVEESLLYEKQPEYALLFSWHIAEELTPKIWQKGFRGDFIVPLPMPRILRHTI